MATRCQVGFYQKKPTIRGLKKWEALIYRHWDGYPSAVMDDLTEIIREFGEGRGYYDLEYMSAWLVRTWKDDFLNIGISKDLHGDIEYLYAVHPKGIDVYEIDWGNNYDEFNFIGPSEESVLF